jgi:hypothetical protein
LEGFKPRIWKETEESFNLSGGIQTKDLKGFQMRSRIRLPPKGSRRNETPKNAYYVLANQKNAYYGFLI